MADNFTCPRMIDVISVSLARASKVVTARSLFNAFELCDIENVRKGIAASQTPIENNSQNAFHAFKVNTMLNNPPSYTFGRDASHIVIKLLDFANNVWKGENWSGIAGPLRALTGGVSSLSIRMIEHWEYSVGSGLFDPVHYDTDSVLTMVVLLSSENEFEGGLFQTNEPNGEMLTHTLRQGDAICFVSHKFHSITPITRGNRKTLVMELWQGGVGHMGRGD